MSRPLGAPGEFICMMDAHWVTLSRLLKKKLMPTVAISTFPNVTKVFEEFRERMLVVWFAVQQQSFPLICFVCMARVFCFCEEMLVFSKHEA